MLKKELIIALSKSNLYYDPSVIPLLWELNGDIPEHIVDSLLTALESATEEHPEIIRLLLASPGMNCTSDAQQE
jgi:hypothetical protein